MWLKRLLRDKWLLFLLILTILVRWFSANENWVEQGYTYGIYPWISKSMRFLFGWFPFPIGDILYILAGVYLLILAIKLFKHLRKRTFKHLDWIMIFKRGLNLILLVYLLFNIFWGLNYDRLGIAFQMQLEVEKYSNDEIIQLTSTLQKRLNNEAQGVTTHQRFVLENNKISYQLGIASFKDAASNYSFLNYSNPSIKSSLFSQIGHYFGFTGYFNPFTGEAQLNTAVPSFLKPFIVNHEIGHQVGFGKENEANFVAYLVGKDAKSPIVRYSTYFEAYLYAVRDLRRRDTTLANAFQNGLHQQVKNDIEELIMYYKKKENKLEPYFARFYNQYLKMNRQPKGTRTYNEVVAWLIAYQKKYGTTAI